MSQYSIKPPKGKYTAVPQGYDTSYETWESPWDVAQGLGNIATGTAKGFGYDLSDPQSLAEALALSFFIPGPLKNVAKNIKKGAKTAGKSVTPSGRKQLRADAKKKIIDANKSKTKAELLNEAAEAKLGPTMTEKFKNIPKNRAQGLRNMFNPKMNPIRKSLLASLWGKNLYEQYQSGQGPGQEGYNPLSSLAYFPIPGLKGFSPASYFGAQHWLSDLFGSGGAPSKKKRIDIDKIVDESAMQIETPLIEMTGMKGQIDSLLNVEDYENLKKLADRDSTLHDYIKTKLKF